MTPRAEDVERFRARVRALLGLKLETETVEMLAQVLSERARARRMRDVASYLLALEQATGGDEEAGVLAQRLTVGETYFFRNTDQLRAVSEHVIPRRVAARGERRELRVLSAGCATGDEAYTLAILAHEHPLLAGWDVSIKGVDVNPASVEKARRGRYSEWALRQTPEACRDLYFRREGSDYVIAEPLRRLVHFEPMNLLDLSRVGGDHDIVFFRNVGIYLSAESFQGTVAALAQALAPGGFLFLGDAETLRNVSTRFALVHHEGAFFYELAAPRATSAPPRFAVEERVPPPTPATPRASESRAATAPPAAPATHDLEAVHELLESERFAEALAALDALSPDASAAPATRLLRAVLLVQTGDMASAERLCEELLRIDEVNAGAYYLKALCREHAGDGEGAVESDRAAIYLEPAFVMPRVHLGLLARKRGDRETARRSIGRALELLATEDAARILLFGGGFSRDALVAVCRAELSAAEGAA